jgi:hypothetical protein
MRVLPAAAILTACIASPSLAETSCIPNANASGSPPFVDGCPLPAANLNKLWNPGGAVSPAIYRSSDDPDDTASIQKALSSCNSVVFSSNTTYTISAPLSICPGGHQKISGSGSSSVIKLVASFDVTQATPCNAASDNASWRAIFYNTNCGGEVGNPSTYVDKYIEYSDFKIDASAVPSAKDGTIAIFNRNTQYVYIHGITCDSFADCTATLASYDTLEDSNVAFNNYNAGFDFWDSPHNVTVVNSTTHCVVSPVSAGFYFNSADTTARHNGNASNYASTSNKALECAYGLFIDPLTAAGTITGINVANLLVDAYSGTVKYGILISGHVSGGQVVAPIIQNIADGVGIRLSRSAHGGSYAPDHITITSPQFINMSTNTAGHAPLYLLGNNTNQATNVIFNGRTYPYAVDVDTTGRAAYRRHRRE